MSADKTSPVVYIYHGEDTFSIEEKVAKLKAEIGEASLVELNTTRLEGRSLNFDDLVNATRAAPFLTRRRLVLLANPTSRFSSLESRKKLTDILEAVPEYTSLVISEDKTLKPPPEDTKKGHKVHWLVQWATQAGERVCIQHYPVPKKGALVAWVQKQVESAGGQFSRSAVEALIELTGENTLALHQEIIKLLTYVNFQRQVEVDDVRQVTSDINIGNIFTLVDAIGEGKLSLAQNALQRLLADQEAKVIFAMVVRQFRFILLAKEIALTSGNPKPVLKRYHIQDFVWEKVTSQARRFKMDALEGIYRRLLEIDAAAKLSQMDYGLALDVFIASFASGVN